MSMDLLYWTNVRPVHLRRLPVAVALAGVVVVAAGCGATSSGSNSVTATSASSRSSSAGSPSQAASVTGAIVTEADNPKLGKILVDARGRTLYLFEKDTGGTSSCSGSCASVWPPLTTSGAPTSGGGVSASALGTTSRSGRTQVTYHGRPLYYYVSDSGPGQIGGQGLTQFGALWYAVSLQGQAITHSSGSPTSPSRSSGGGGGGYGG